jgi:RHS repeat-associated protein
VLIAKASVTNGVSFYERDSETATDYAVNRQYNQSVGRFNQADPMSGSLETPQSLNRFAYVQNDPINSADPLGLNRRSFCGFFILGSDGETHYWGCHIYDDGFGEPTDPSVSGSEANKYEECRSKVFGTANMAGVLPIPNARATNSILENSHNDSNIAAMVAGIWGKESNFVRRPTGDHGPAQLTSWWLTNHPDLIVPGAYDVDDPAHQTRSGNFQGSVQANLETLANIVRFSYQRYGNWRSVAYWYGPGTAAIPRDQYANDVMSAFSQFQDFFRCMTTN